MTPDKVKTRINTLNFFDKTFVPHDVGYFPKIQNWKFQAATLNNTTLYPGGI